MHQIPVNDSKVIKPFLGMAPSDRFSEAALEEYRRCAESWERGVGQVEMTDELLFLVSLRMFDAAKKSGGVIAKREKRTQPEPAGTP